MTSIIKLTLWGMYVGGMTAVLFDKYFMHWEWWLFFVATYSDFNLDNTQK